jgi:hypothetical protein
MKPPGSPLSRFASARNWRCRWALNAAMTYPKQCGAVSIAIYQTAQNDGSARKPHIES